MTYTKLALALLVGVGAGCAGVAPAPSVALSNLPNCFDSNYDKERSLFTIKSDTGNPVNQQCLLTVGPQAYPGSQPALVSGRNYRVYLSNGGGGGGGGSLQALRPAGAGVGGGGGGGGAGAAEMQTTVNLAEGVYKLTLGGGGPGGTYCKPGAGISGGPGWVGSPSSMIRVATGELVIGTPGADTYKRVTRAANDRLSGARDGHGGSGTGQTSGGQGAAGAIGAGSTVAATPGESKVASGRVEPGGAAGTLTVADKTPGSGGGGGATSIGVGGQGGGESMRQRQSLPERGSLGSGGGGGEGSLTECDPGARGGHGYIALRQM